MYRFLKISFFAMFRLSAIQMYFSSTIRIQKCTGLKIHLFLRCLDDLQFKCIFHRQPGSGSEIKVKAGSESGSEKKKFKTFESTTLAQASTAQAFVNTGVHPRPVKGCKLLMA
jgi:hypothetical protein